jgi:PAN domain
MGFPEASFRVIMTLRHSTSYAKGVTAARQKREVHVTTVIQPSKGRTKMNKGYSTKATVVGGLAFLILSLFAYPAYSQRISVGGQIFGNTDLPGSNIGVGTPIPKPPAGGISFPVSTCQGLCAQNSSCVAFTLVNPGIQGPEAMCWIKSALPAKATNSCCTSGTIAEVNTDRPGGDYLHFSQFFGQPIPVGFCEYACVSQTQCTAWTFVKSGNTCWLKSVTPPPAPVANNCCVSGTIETIPPTK